MWAIEINLATKKYVAGALFLSGSWASCETQCRGLNRLIPNGPALQGHPQSLILAPIVSACATSYWSWTVTSVLTFPVSEILQVFCWEERPHRESSTWAGEQRDWQSRRVFRAGKQLFRCPYVNTVGDGASWWSVELWSIKNRGLFSSFKSG